MRTTKPKGTLEVHRHSYVSGPRGHGGCYDKGGVWLTSDFEHSHVGGDRQHEHPHTGPAAYTIDTDDWYRSTGLVGGGRKVFTATPTGEQLPLVARDPAKDVFELHICDPLPSHGQPGYIGEGPGIALPLRMMKTFQMRCVVIDGTTPKRRKRS